MTRKELIKQLMKIGDDDNDEIILTNNTITFDIGAISQFKDDPKCGPIFISIIKRSPFEYKRI